MNNNSNNISNSLNYNSPIHNINFNNYVNNRNGKKINNKINLLKEKNNDVNLNIEKSNSNSINENKENILKQKLENDNTNINLNIINKNNSDKIQENSNDSLIIKNDLNISKSSDQNLLGKVPKLLNNITNLFDMNSDRIKKRSQQMKKMKDKIGNRQNDENLTENRVEYDFIKNKNICEKDIEKSIKLSLMKNNSSINCENDNLNNNSLNYPNPMILTSKKFQEEPEIFFQLIEEKTKSPINLKSNEKEKAMFSATSNTDADATDNNTNNDQAAEIVISDLDCDLEELNEINTHSNLNTSNNNSSNKSFIPMNNNLKEKNSLNNNKEKATPSYLMALFQYEDSDSSETYNKINSSMDNLKHDCDALNTLPLKLVRKNKNNYYVDNVIEEETSEHNTDMDLSGKKKTSFFYSKLNLSEKNLSKDLLGENSICSPYNKKKIYFFNSNYNISVNGNSNSHHQVNNSLISKRQSKSEIFKKDDLGVFEKESENEENIKNFLPFHKPSKSELINIKFDLKIIVNNIHMKYLNNEGEKLVKKKLRKTFLLNTFSKSNSHHDFEKIYNLSKDSNDLINEKLKFNMSPRRVSSFMSKKLTPSSISRAKFYEEFFEEKEFSLIDKLKENKSICKFSLENGKNKKINKNKINCPKFEVNKTDLNKKKYKNNDNEFSNKKINLYIEENLIENNKRKREINKKKLSNNVEYEGIHLGSLISSESISEENYERENNYKVEKNLSFIENIDVDKNSENYIYSNINDYHDSKNNNNLIIESIDEIIVEDQDSDNNYNSYKDIPSHNNLCSKIKEIKISNENECKNPVVNEYLRIMNGNNNPNIKSFHNYCDEYETNSENDKNNFGIEINFGHNDSDIDKFKEMNNSVISFNYPKEDSIRKENEEISNNNFINFNFPLVKNNEKNLEKSNIYNKNFSQNNNRNSLSNNFINYQFSDKKENIET